MLEIKLSADLGSSPEAVWSVVGNFNGLPDWHPWVKASVLEPAAGGIGRRVMVMGGTAGHRELTERLVFFDASAREYAYTIIAGPVPFTDYVGWFRVVAPPRAGTPAWTCRLGTISAGASAEPADLEGVSAESGGRS